MLKDFKQGVPFCSVEAYRGQMRLGTNYTHAVIDALGIKEGHRVLDIGCGPGYHSALAHVRGAEVHAIDLSKENVELAKRVVAHIAELAKAGKFEPPSQPGSIQKIILDADRTQNAVQELPGFHVHHGDATELDKHIPDKKEYFDAILILDMLHLVEMTHGMNGVRKLLLQANEKLKPGGKLLAYTSARGSKKKSMRC